MKPYRSSLATGALRALPLLSLSVLVAACYAAAADGSSATSPPSGSNAPAGPTGLTCEVQTLLADRCWSCHGVTLAKDVPYSLTSFDDLAAKDSSGKTRAQLSVDRMNDRARPMPPSGAPPADAVAPLEAWIAAGMPQGNCGEVDSVFTKPSQCESGKSKVKEGADMDPGGACIECHTRKNEKKVIFAFAGTVFPYGHEELDCIGSNGLRVGMKVVITGADGKVLQLPVSRAGNFSTMTNVKKPYRAKVVVGDLERVMETEQQSGDCNACHTAEGTTTVEGGDKAPGRIVAP